MPTAQTMPPIEPPAGRVPLRAARAGLMLAVLLLLQACGPGLGGTGTGAMYGPADFGAQRASACDSVLATALGCPDVVASQPAVELREFAGLDGAAGLRLLLDDRQAWLQATCAGLSFEGEWGQRISGEQGFFGSVLVAGSSESRPAWLEVTPAEAAGGDAPARLAVTLRTSEGEALLGPTWVQRVPVGDSPPAPGCG